MVVNNYWLVYKCNIMFYTQLGFVGWTLNIIIIQNLSLTIKKGINLTIFTFLMGPHTVYFCTRNIPLQKVDFDRF